MDLGVERGYPTWKGNPYPTARDARGTLASVDCRAARLDLSIRQSALGAEESPLVGDLVRDYFACGRSAIVAVLNKIESLPGRGEAWKAIEHLAPCVSPKWQPGTGCGQPSA
jgi:hypothetical protein